MKLINVDDIEYEGFSNDQGESYPDFVRKSSIDQMDSVSLEDLRAAAEEMGYLLVKKKQPMPKLLPCVCGEKRKPEEWTNCSVSGGKFYRCPKCRLRGAVGASRSERIKNWNAAVLAASMTCGD